MKDVYVQEKTLDHFCEDFEFYPKVEVEIFQLCNLSNKDRHNDHNIEELYHYQCNEEDM